MYLEGEKSLLFLLSCPLTTDMSDYRLFHILNLLKLVVVLSSEDESG
jgi:hypothetical protein